MSGFNYKSCLICKGGTKNDSLYFHKDPDTGEIWIWCQGKCQRGYSLYSYCYESGYSVREFLKLKIDFEEAKPNEVNAMGWPRYFINLSDPSAKQGVEYLQTRGLTPTSDMYYDSDQEGIVLAYYMDSTFVGAQVRFIEPRKLEDGSPWKITTLPGTRLGYLFWGWSQNPLPQQVKYLVVTEGAFNAAALQQALNTRYGGILSNPYRCIASSGSGASEYQRDKLRDVLATDVKVIAAPDNDSAGLRMLEKIQNSAACSHFALVEEDGKDWNDKLLELGDLELAKYFSTRLRKT
jgi:hypothetical protein